jgi:hypothetical protein
MELDFNNIINKRVRNEVLALCGIRSRTKFKPFDPEKVLLEHVELEISKHNNHVKDIVYLRLLDGNKTSKYIKLTFPNEYPFRPPSIDIGAMCYEQLLKELSCIARGDFVPENKCLCCESITCKNKWGPALNIHYMVKEIRNSIELVTSMSTMVSVSKIIDKHVGGYVPIDTYLLPEEYTGMNHHFWKKYFA